MSAALIEISHITKIFGNGVQALADFSLTLAKGEFVSIIGPSGCGKSTVLSLIAGLASPSSGQLAWQDAGKPRIGLVFQEATLMPWASIADNVALPLRLRGQARDDVAPLLARVGLQGFAGAYPRQLSGGMKMRVSLARALVAHPDLLLLDEPFAALDEITRYDLIDQLLTLWQAQNFTALFVTHSIGESVFMSQRVVVMGARPGRVLAEISVPEPYPRPPEWRADPRYAACCGQVLAALKSASAA